MCQNETEGVDGGMMVLDMAFSAGMAWGAIRTAIIRRKGGGNSKCYTAEPLMKDTKHGE